MVIHIMSIMAACLYRYICELQRANESSTLCNSASMLTYSQLGKLLPDWGHVPGTSGSAIH